MSRAFLLAAIAVAAAVIVAIVLSTTGAPATENASSTVDRLRQCRPGDTAPTVVLVHGAWADAASWAGEVRLLQRAGVRVRAIANPVENLTTDARYVADFLQTITRAYRARRALVRRSGDHQRRSRPRPESRRWFMSTRRHLPPGRPTGSSAAPDRSSPRASPATLYKTVPRPSYAPGAHELYLRKNVFVEDFASDLPRTEAVRLWASQRGASTAAFMTPSRTAAWKTIPSWFFVSTGDRIITPDSQLAMARRARARVTTFRGGSHLTLISHPEAVAAVIASAICDTTR